MSLKELEKLDNPVWHSLSETQHDYVIEAGNVKFYKPDYCPFGGFISSKNISKAIDEYANLIPDFFMVGNKPPLSESLKLNNELVCNQMIINQKASINITEEIQKLNEEHADELYNLVNLVQPGYFRKQTFQLGNYYGIFRNNELIAVTGERMQMNKYVEISAVVTHPHHTGKGYAKQLVAYALNKVFDRNKIPYLHVSATNTAAISLYEKLGFETRRKISFWNIIK